MTVTLKIVSKFWSLNNVFIMSHYIYTIYNCNDYLCLNSTVLFTKCFWREMQPSRRHYWFLFPRIPFWRPRPTGSWGNWLTGCAEFEPTLCWTVCARGFVGCPQWYDLLWEQKGLTFCFILTYPRVCVYSVSVFYYGNSFLHSVSILFLCYILSYTHLLPLS